MKGNFIVSLYRKLQKAILLTVVSMIFISCSSKNENKTRRIEDIYSEKGLPVRTIEVRVQPFEKKLIFYANLTGIREATKGSMLSDKVEKIYFKPGQYVKEKQIVLKFTTDNPTLQYEQAKLAYENAQKTYNRLKELHSAGETSQQILDNAETQYFVAKRNFESLKQMIYVEAPISGILSYLYVSEGQQVETGKPLFTISVLDRVKAVTWVNEKEVQYLKPNMKAKIIWNGKEYSCVISSISLKMDERLKGFKVEFEAPNPKMELKSGVTVKIEVPVYLKEKAIVIPSKIVNYDNEKFPYVWTYKNGYAQVAKVKLGETFEDKVEVLNGLTAGDTLIVEGIQLLSANQKVRIIEK